MIGRNLACELCVPEDERALDVFRCIRWSDGVYCPECKSFEVYKRGYLNKTRIKRYSCKICKKNFTDLTGTIFANKKLPLGEMFYIIMNLDKKSIKHLAEELGHKWDSVYRIAHQFRECVVSKSDDPVLSGEIEL
ncbi:MAG: transposase [Methanobacteriaceae archaeon]|nr:transposase [Methanobacteriaceae archaeon]